MDDNLTIHLEDYLQNPTIIEKFHFSREEVLEALKHTSNFLYDSINDTFCPTYKPKRRIIVCRDIPKDRQTEVEIRKLFNIEEDDKFLVKIEKIEKINEMFFVYFANEEDTIEAFRWLEKLRDSTSKVNFKLLINLAF